MPGNESAVSLAEEREQVDSSCLFSTSLALQGILAGPPCSWNTGDSLRSGRCGEGAS